MKDYGKVRSTVMPKTVEITSAAVYVATNIVPFEETIEEYTISGYEYDYVEYTKDEYIIILTDKTVTLQADLLDTQQALCDVYESLEQGVVVQGGNA